MREHKGMKQHVEELEDLFGGRGGLTEALGVSTSAVSNWIQFGVPAQQRFRIIVKLNERGQDPPDWLMTPAPVRPGKGRHESKVSA